MSARSMGYGESVYWILVATWSWVGQAPPIDPLHGRWEPQPWPSPAPGIAADPRPAPVPPGLFEALYRGYRRANAADTQGTCPYFPTCSGYGILAVRAHGPAFGVLLTVDRLLREYPGMDAFDHYPIITVHGRGRFSDPVPGT
jgi:putative component of membrane protein insertase Oxa1/YidC/SpoIIIJ protein YidD